VRIVAALFIDDMELRQVPGPSTRIDLKGIRFSEVAPAPVPVTVTPHLVVMLYCPPEDKPEAALEVTYHREDERIARNLQLVEVEPGKFSYRLVRAELEFAEYGTVEARCRIDDGDPMVVPFTLLAPPTG
jgi:hypothetical protein